MTQLGFAGVNLCVGDTESSWDSRLHDRIHLGVGGMGHLIGSVSGGLRTAALQCRKDALGGNPVLKYKPLWTARGGIPADGSCFSGARAVTAIGPSRYTLRVWRTNLWRHLRQI